MSVRGLDGDYYTEPDIFAAELDRIFAHTWQMVGHASQVAQPGQVLTAQVGDERVFLANDAGVVAAFYNVCQHRGHELVPADATGLKSISCPYHAWTYDLGGKLVHARGEDVGDICVPKIRVDSLAGFLFVNLDVDAVPMKDVFPGIEAELLRLAPDAAKRVLTSRRTHLVKANWKIAVENYNECYHCPNVHKAFTGGVVSPESYRIEPRGFTIRHTADGSALGNAAYERSADANDYGAFFAWPVSSIQCYPGRVLNTFRWVPIAVDETLLIREWWFDDAVPTAEQCDIIELDWDTTVSEDFDLMESVQRGVGSRGYSAGPLISDPTGVATVHSEDAVPHLNGLLKAALDQ